MKTKCVVFSCLVLLLACSKKDKDNPFYGERNSYTYQNGGELVTVKIEKAAFEYDGAEMLLHLYKSENNEHLRMLLVNQKTAFSGMPEGTFSGNESPINIYFAGADLRYNGEKTSTIKNTDRKMTITKNKDNYTLIFELTSGIGIIKGNYTGIILKRN